MKPIEFPEANRVLLKPESMTDEECGALSVCIQGDEVISCWRPSFSERLSILLFGKVWLSVWRPSIKSQPPVRIIGARNLFLGEATRKEMEDGI